MSWHVGIVSNTLKISEECAEDLMQTLPNHGTWDKYYYGDEAWPAEDDGTLFFDEEHREHIDYIDDQVIAILTKHKANGAVRFADVEQGSNIWEHSFVDGVYSYKYADLANIAL